MPPIYAQALEFAINPSQALPPYDGRHRRMSFGFGYLPVSGGPLQATQPVRDLWKFESVDLRIAREIRFDLKLCTAAGIVPQILVLQFRPSMDALAESLADPPHSPLVGGNTEALIIRDFGDPVLGGTPVPALKNESFGAIWTLPWLLRVPGPGIRWQYELLVDLLMSSEGKSYHFKVDPELIIEGEGK